MVVLKSVSEYFKFPAGEVHIRQDELAVSPIIYIPKTENLNLNDHLMAVLQATEVQRRESNQTLYNEYSLFLPYLPYARQDRPTSHREPFSLQIVGDILNLQGYRNIYTLDVHSDVAYGCIRNLKNIPVKYMVNLMLKFHPELAAYTLVVPDQGASKRLQPIQHLFDDVVTAIKYRNTDTGRVEVKEITGENPAGKYFLIVDDLCDGGATFIQLAEELYKRRARHVELAVSHGIFSKGTSGLQNAGICKIYTTDSFNSLMDRDFSYPEQNVSVYDVEDLLREYLTTN